MGSSISELELPVTVGVISTSRPSTPVANAGRITIRLIVGPPVAIALARALSLRSFSLGFWGATIGKRLSYALEGRFGAQPQNCQPPYLITDHFCEVTSHYINSAAKLEKKAAELQSFVVACFDLKPACHSLRCDTLSLHCPGDGPDFGSRFAVELHSFGVVKLCDFCLPLGSGGICHSFLVEPLLFQGSMVNALGAMSPLKRRIYLAGPIFTPLAQQFAVVPRALFRTEAEHRGGPGRQKDVAMLVAVIAFPMSSVNGNVRHHSFSNEVVLHELPDKTDPLFAREFVRQGQLNFTCELRVFPALHLLHPIPELAPIENPARGAGRRQNLDVRHALSPSVIELDPGPIINQHFARPIGGGGRYRAATASADHLRGKPVDSHISFAPLVGAPAPRRSLNFQSLSALGTAKAAKLMTLLEFRLPLFCSTYSGVAAATYKRAILS
jgi:hypothetical protein